TDMIGTYNIDVKAINEWDDEVTHNFEIEIDPIPIYRNLFKLSDSAKHTKFIEDVVLDTLDGESQETFKAIKTLINDFRVNPRDLAVKLITGLSNNGSAEIQTVNKLYEAFPELANLDYNYTLMLTESNYIQNKESISGDSVVRDMINGFSNLNNLELRVRSPTIRNIKATDSGDTYTFCYTTFADEVGLDTSNATDARICEAFSAWYDGVFNDDDEVNDTWIKEYMIDQAKAIGVSHLRELSRQKDGLIYLGYGIAPIIQGASNSKYSFSEIAIPAEQYQRGRDLWDHLELDDVVLGKSIADASSDAQARIAEHATGDLNAKASKNWTNLEEWLDNLEAGNKPAGDCNKYSETFSYLLQCQNDKYISAKGKINNEGDGVPYKAPAIFVYEHAGVVTPWHNETGVFGLQSDVTVNIQLSQDTSDYIMLTNFEYTRELKGPDHQNEHVYGTKDIDMGEDMIIAPHYKVKQIPEEKIGNFTEMDEIVKHTEQLDQIDAYGPVGWVHDSGIVSKYSLVS
ncbi:hypothetical protein HOD83_00445, partial [Candidatus Woesearchaeota archaeon]|nr:hypothetical protein [Candidatus Woesearchaeota archaeon]